MWLSCDHTFRLVANVGIVRNADKRWIKQYKGLFCVLNCFGEVLSWKLTKSLKFDEVEASMMIPNDRLHRQGIIVHRIFAAHGGIS